MSGVSEETAHKAIEMIYQANISGCGPVSVQRNYQIQP